MPADGTTGPAGCGTAVGAGAAPAAEGPATSTPRATAKCRDRTMSPPAQPEGAGPPRPRRPLGAATLWGSHAIARRMFPGQVLDGGFVSARPVARFTQFHTVRAVGDPNSVFLPVRILDSVCSVDWHETSALLLAAITMLRPYGGPFRHRAPSSATALSQACALSHAGRAQGRFPSATGHGPDVAPGGSRRAAARRRADRPAARTAGRRCGSRSHAFIRGASPPTSAQRVTPRSKSSR